MLAAIRKISGIVAVIGLASAAVLTLLAFGLVFAGFAEPLGSGSGEWLNHAGASCFALSRLGWVLALVGGGAYAALVMGSGQADATGMSADVIPPDAKPRAGARGVTPAAPDNKRPSLD